MASVRDEIISLLQNLPEDVGYDEILYEIYVHNNIDEGLAQLDQGEYLTHEEVIERLKQWLQ